MSWQSIDENTSIDDTLVTCAEYHLFIDEMREQGKYYQPDHWTSYQFPAGQAHEPILGVRYSDAAAFCEWLTQREIGEWKYSLPAKEAAKQLKMKIFAGKPLCYWVQGKYQFVWVTSLPKNSRRIDFEKVLIRDLELTRRLIIDLAHTRDRRHARSEALDNARSLANELKLDLVKARRLLNISRFIRTGNLARDLAHNLARTQYSPLTPGNHLYLSELYSHPLDLDLDRDLVSTLVHDLRYVFDIATKQLLERSLTIYLDIYTLRERIAGRSPAFEGIRLVKERIR
jgi:hypothetical protein